MIRLLGVGVSAILFVGYFFMGLGTYELTTGYKRTNMGRVVDLYKISDETTDGLVASAVKQCIETKIEGKLPHWYIRHETRMLNDHIHLTAQYQGDKGKSKEAQDKLEKLEKNNRRRKQRILARTRNQSDKIRGNIKTAMNWVKRLKHRYRRCVAKTVVAAAAKDAA